MNLEAQIVDRLTLPHIAVYDGLEIQLRRVRHDLGAYNLRSQRRICIKSLGEIPLRYSSGEFWVALQLSGTDIVTTQIAANIFVRIGFRHILGVLGNNKAQFAFIVGLAVLGKLWNDDRCAVVI